MKENLEFVFHKVDDSCKHEVSNPEYEIVLRTRYKQAYEAQIVLNYIQNSIENWEKILESNPDSLMFDYNELKKEIQSLKLLRDEDSRIKLELREQNEEYKKVIDEIRNWYKQCDFDNPYDAQYFLIEIRPKLRVILSKIGCDFPLGRQYCAEHRDKIKG